MDHLLFDNWQSVARTAILTFGAYALMVFLLRISGKRTLSKMNAFDFVVTVAMGSVLATISLSKTTGLIDGLVGFGVLILLQAALTAASVRSKAFKRLITAQPTLLLWAGKPFPEQLKKERIALDELYSAARKAGHAGLDTIEAIVLETTGDLTVLGAIKSQTKDALQDVQGFPPAGPTSNFTA